MLQIVMGWENAHPYLFRLTLNARTAVYGLPDPARAQAGEHVRDSRRAKLDTTVWIDVMELTYEYDLEHSWVHQITVEKIEQLAEDQNDASAFWCTPRCLAGARACPLEGVGGVEGYAFFLEALRNPEHPEHEQLRHRAGASYDPELFALRQVNAGLAVLN
jgi:hypothetical protein